MKSTVYIVAHKKIEIIYPDNYKPIQVGKIFNKIDLGYISDDTKNNIAKKNKNFCELTALYWIWKNEKLNDYVGLVHYRRYFYDRNKIIGDKKISKILSNNDIILPKKFYFNDCLWDNYFKNGAGKEKDLRKLKRIIKDKYPKYIDSFNKVMKSYNGSYCNMFIMRKELLNDYCKWLFDILFQLEKETDLSDYTKEEARIYGYLSEILLNVWVDKNNLKAKYVKIKKIDDSFKLSMYIKLKMLKNRILKIGKSK